MVRQLGPEIRRLCTVVAYHICALLCDGAVRCLSWCVGFSRKGTEVIVTMHPVTVCAALLYCVTVSMCLHCRIVV